MVDLTSPASTLAGQAVLVILTIISTLAMLWKTSRDQKHSLDMMRLQRELDAADRREQSATDRAKQEQSASAIRERLITDAAAVQVQLHTSANAVRDRVDAVASRTDGIKTELKEDSRFVVALQTQELKVAIEAAKMFTADKADAAYRESNDVNRKLKELHEAHAAQGEILRRLLDMLSRGVVVPPPVEPT